MISIFTDGSSHARGGKPGGWAYVIVRGDQALVAGVGNNPSTTNNIMELQAVLEGLQMLIKCPALRKEGEEAELVTDSQYAGGIATGSYTPSKNLELANAVRTAFLDAKMTSYRWVKGHSGDTWNERVDSLAHGAKMELVPKKVKDKLAAKKLKARAAS